MDFIRQARAVLGVIPPRLRPLVSGAIWERVMLVVGMVAVAAKGHVDSWTLWQQLLAAASVLVLLQALFRLVAWIRQRVSGPLNLEVTNRAITTQVYHGGQPQAPGTGYIGLPDIMILNREPRKVLLQITLKSETAGPFQGPFRPSIECLGGHVVIENNAPPHLRTEIPLDPDEHDRGCVEFVMYSDEIGNPEATEGMTVVITDRLSRKSLTLPPIEPARLLAAVRFLEEELQADGLP